MERGRRRFLCQAMVGSVGLMRTASVRATSPTGRLHAGAAVADITPPMGASLQGPVGGNGILKKVHDPLHARVLVLDNGTTRFAVCVCDVTMIWEQGMERAKRLVRERIGLPVDHILISTTHSHAAPRICGLSDAKIDLDYCDTVEHRIADAICQAVSNLAPAEIGFGVVKKPEFVQGRRWRIDPGSNGPNPLGQQTDSAWMHAKPATRIDPKPLGRTDPYLSIVSVRYADGAPLAVLGNYSIHYVGGFERNCVSADYFACFAEEIGRLLAEPSSTGNRPAFVGIMTNGNSGNIGSARGASGYTGMRKVGQVLAEAAGKICDEIEYVAKLPLDIVEERLELGVRRPDAERIRWARDVLAGKGNQPAHPWTQIYAQGALRLANYPAVVSPKFQAIRIGDLGIAANPCEMYAETGLEIRERSPFKTTFNVQLANGYCGYIPTPEQHALGGYTTWPNISSFLEIEASSKIRNHLLELLTNMRSA